MQIARFFTITVLITIIFLSCSKDDDTQVVDQINNASAESILNIVDKVISWQEKNPSYINDGKYGWGPATYYIGLMELYKVVKIESVKNSCLKWAEGADWKLKRKTTNADNHAAGQVYFELYKYNKNSQYIIDTQAYVDPLFDEIIDRQGKEIWWWIDALFMSPPLLAKFGEEKNANYYNLLDSLWWDAFENLYDEQYNLVYRDSRYFNSLNKNSKKIFWSRGQGWCLGGLVGVLKSLPQNHPLRGKYEEILIEMSNSLRGYQNIHGLWYPNIIDSEIFPDKEISGSSLIIYAMAYGYNNEILDESYRDTITKGWNGLVDTVKPSGSLSWVQSSNAEPAKVFEDETHMYGTGGFLLAASEILKMN